MQDVNQVFLTRKKLAHNSTDMVTSSVSSSSSSELLLANFQNTTNYYFHLPVFLCVMLL